MRRKRVPLRIHSRIQESQTKTFGTFCEIRGKRAERAAGTRKLIGFGDSQKTETAKGKLQQ